MKFIEHYAEPGTLFLRFAEVVDWYCCTNKGRNLSADLSPAATFIAYYYNNSIDTKLFVKK